MLPSATRTQKKHVTDPGIGVMDSYESPHGNHVLGINPNPLYEQEILGAETSPHS